MPSSLVERLREWLPWTVVRTDELHDLCYRFSCVLDHATDGRMSKTNYTKEAMYAQIDDAFTRCAEQAVEDAIADGEVVRATLIRGEGEGNG